MQHRCFTDRHGTAWTAFEVVELPPAVAENRERRAMPRSTRRPTGTPRLATRRLGLPWLCFESHGARRRLAPVPPSWLTLPEDELEDLLGQSAPVDAG